MLLLPIIGCLLVAMSHASPASPQLTEAIVSENLPWRCHPPLPDMTPTTWHDCIGLANEISNLGARRYKLIFSTETSPDVDYIIPKTFTHGSCSAVIGPIQEHARIRDAIYAQYLSRMIVTMTERCVLPSPHLGGVGEIGNNRRLALALWGSRSTGNPAVELSFNLTSIQ